MNNWLKDALTVDVTVPQGGVTSGGIVAIAGIIGVANSTELAGDKVAVLTEAVFLLPKATGYAWTEGMPLYWDRAAQKAIPRPVGPYIGEAESEASEPAASGRVLVRPARSPLAAAPRTFAITDSDDAASNGTPVMVAVAATGTFLVSANAGSADSHVIDQAGSDVIVVDYNANPAANLGAVQVYVKEDGADGARLLCNSPFGLDLWVPTLNGRLVRIAHDADAATEGVALYFDDDGIAAGARLLFVSPTDTASGQSTSRALAAAA